MLLVKVVLFEVLVSLRTNILSMNFGNTKNKKYQSRSNHQNLYNPFSATYLFLNPLKTPENQKFSDVFSENKTRSVT